jgi:hypothetical protein
VKKVEKLKAKREDHKDLMRELQEFGDDTFDDSD